jgi:hypothetical protein
VINEDTKRGFRNKRAMAYNQWNSLMSITQSSSMWLLCLKKTTCSHSIYSCMLDVYVSVWMYPWLPGKSYTTMYQYMDWWPGYIYDASVNHCESEHLRQDRWQQINYNCRKVDILHLFYWTFLWWAGVRHDLNWSICLNIFFMQV